MPRQLWNILTRPHDAFYPVTNDDKITVAIEFGSSAAHPMTDRVLIQELLRAEPYTHILTVNPDRLTRRSDEVVSLLARLGSAVWWTCGCQTDDVTQNEWCAVSEAEDSLENVVRPSIIEEQLRKGISCFVMPLVISRVHC